MQVAVADLTALDTSWSFEKQPRLALHFEPTKISETLTSSQLCVHPCLSLLTLHKTKTTYEHFPRKLYCFSTGSNWSLAS